MEYVAPAKVHVFFGFFWFFLLFGFDFFFPWWCLVKVRVKNGRGEAELLKGTAG